MSFENNGVEYFTHEETGSPISFPRFGNSRETAQKFVSRLVVRRGAEYLLIFIKDVAYFTTENGIVFLITKDDKRYIVNKKLTHLEKDLDPGIFYRANRQFIINVNFLKSFKPIGGEKLKIELTLPAKEDIIVSQYNSGVFREWIEAV